MGNHRPILAKMDQHGPSLANMVHCGPMLAIPEKSSIANLTPTKGLRVDFSVHTNLPFYLPHSVLSSVMHTSMFSYFYFTVKAQKIRAIQHFDEMKSADGS